MKQMPLSDVVRLKRIMGMTFSEHDGEALSALRKANELLAKHGLTWPEVLGRSVAPVTNGYAGPVDEDNDEMSLEQQIQEAFDELRGVPLGRFREFIDSLEQQFATTKYLSQAQRKPLFDAVRRHREKRR